MAAREKIAVVEDNIDTMKIINIILESEGYRIINAVNGEQAKKIIEEERPDLIILDVMIPKIDGFSLCSWIRSRDGLKDIPIVLLTSVSRHIYNSKHSHKEMMYADIDEYLEKPVRPEVLLKVIKRLL